MISVDAYIRNNGVSFWPRSIERETQIERAAVPGLLYEDVYFFDEEAQLTLEYIADTIVRSRQRKPYIRKPKVVKDETP